MTKVFVTGADGMLGSIICRSLICRDYDVKALCLTEKSSKTIKELSIDAKRLDFPIDILSGGNQQKIMLAKWLATDPKVLLLDDPTRGIDVGAKHDIYLLLSELANSGISIIMSSSELPELLIICDRILVLREGQLSGVFSHDDATQEKIMEAAAPVA